MSDAITFVRSECDMKLQKEQRARDTLQESMNELQEAMATLQKECDQKLAEEKANFTAKIQECMAECEMRINQGKLEEARKTGEFFAQCGENMSATKSLQRKRQTSLPKS